MKKTLLLSGIVLLTLASCADDNDITSLAESQDGQIAFRPAIGTRGVETTNANIGDIYVTALQDTATYFKDITFSKDADNLYTHTPAYYWPGDPGKDYQSDIKLNFYAYSPSLDELGADIEYTRQSGDSIQMTLASYTVPEDIADQQDFVTADAVGSRRANRDTGVPLTFEHRLAQIELRAKNSNENYVVEVAGMRIGRPETTASFNFMTNTWTLDEWHDTYVYESSCNPVTLTSDPVSIMGDAGNAMLIPQTLRAWDVKGDPDNVARGAYLSVKVRITTKDGALVYPFPSTGTTEQYGWAAIPLSGTWNQGTKYVYTLDFTEGSGNVDPDDPTPGRIILDKPIKFTVSVSNWADSADEIDMTPSPAGNDN